MYELLGNGICDPNCDSSYCGFDLGDCGYCSSGCTQKMLENTVCDEDCNTYKCDYDNHYCEICSPGCASYFMVGDNHCDPACDNVACDFDLGDCGRCAEGCTLSMVGDGKCDEACQIYSCRYDSPDCQIKFYGDCYGGNIQDDWCNPECYTVEANWDGGDCDCSNGCTHDKQFNSVCDPECANSDCNLDNYSCVSCYTGLLRPGLLLEHARRRRVQPRVLHSRVRLRPRRLLLQSWVSARDQRQVRLPLHGACVRVRFIWTEERV